MYNLRPFQIVTNPLSLNFMPWMLGFEGQCYYKEKGENCDTKEHQRVILR
jgi:hypothetical protein